MKCSFRFATEKDVSLILDFINGIAKYENLLDEVEATNEELYKSLFIEKRAEVLFVLENNKEVGFALFFHNFSTFKGTKGLYLEDLFIYEEYRKKGYGKALLKELAKIAKERKCKRFEWVCLDWNKPSIEFYLSLGAKKMDEWTIFRLDEKGINDLIRD